MWAMALGVASTPFAQDARTQILADLSRRCLTDLDGQLRRAEVDLPRPVDRTRFCACADEAIRQDPVVDRIASRPESERQPDSKPDQYLHLSHVVGGLECYLFPPGAARPAPDPKARSIEEVRQTFNREAPRISALYNRALRKAPALKGKIVFELRVEPSGKVSWLGVVSSELADKTFEQDLQALVGRIDFGPKGVAPYQFTYPVSFLPE